jgi:hypothetical protein
VASGTLLVLSAGLTALLTPFVFIPWGTGDMTTSQSALWWSPTDQAQATAGAVEGQPASRVPFRPGQPQGFVVLIENHTGYDQKVSDPEGTDPPSALGVGMSVSTSSGTAAQARSLAYRPSGTIPAHQSRWVKMVPYSPNCVSPGGSSSAPALRLKVTIGWTTRLVWIPFHPTMQVTQPAKAAPGEKSC